MPNRRFKTHFSVAFNLKLTVMERVYQLSDLGRNSSYCNYSPKKFLVVM